MLAETDKSPSNTTIFTYLLVRFPIRSPVVVVSSSGVSAKTVPGNPLLLWLFLFASFFLLYAAVFFVLFAAVFLLFAAAFVFICSGFFLFAAVCLFICSVSFICSYGGSRPHIHKLHYI